MVITVSRTAVETPSTGTPAFPIRATTVYDQQGNSTLIEFDGVRLNRGLARGLFNFTPPAGVEIVKPGAPF
jgi:outer membrane lipoprotein carrier protein